MARMSFGIFMAPFHAPIGQNPTAAFARDVKTVQLLDDLGYDEAWIGEHHSGGVETIASPEIFIAHVAALTKRIKLGTGVLSLPYHNPLWVADRAILLDHLTRGRFMLGLGPGALPVDAAMVGIDPAEQRAALEQDTDVLIQLLTTDEPVNARTDRYRLVDAVCQLRPFTDPCFDIAIAAVASPSGARIAGRYGAGLLSIGATMAAGFDALALHWGVMQERSIEFGTTIDRNKWRLVGPMHIAETKEQALKDVRYGIDAWFDYFQHTAAFPQLTPIGSTTEERVAWVVEGGVGVIGTPDDAIAQITRLEKQSGGFGTYLMIANDWANWEATQRSYELFARNVMPQFQNSTGRLFASEHRSQQMRPMLNAKQSQAVQAWTDKHAAEQTAKAGTLVGASGNA
jgi:limonene 1,2-monooxygenase